MTNREFYTAVANGNITEDVIAHATSAIEKLDAALEARKNKVSPKAAEKAAADAVIRENILSFVTNEVQTEADIAAQAGVTPAKARAELRKLVESGLVVKSDVKVPKKGNVKGYSLATTDEVAEG
jgi:Fic family protein